MEIGIYVDTSSLDQALGNIQNSGELLEELKAEGAGLVQFRLYENTPKSTSFMARSIVMRFYDDGFEVLPTAFYTPFVERGTGLFGPKKRLIFPVHAKALRWFSFGKAIFAKYIAGQPGQFFIKRTEEETKPRVFELSDRLAADHFSIEPGPVYAHRGAGGRFV